MISPRATVRTRSRPLPERTGNTGSRPRRRPRDRRKSSCCPVSWLQSPKAHPCCDWYEARGCAARSAIGRASGGPTLEKTIDLVTRSNAAPPRAIDQKSKCRPRPTLPSVFIRYPPASVHSQCNAGHKGSPGDAAWRSPRRTPRIARRCRFPFGQGLDDQLQRPLLVLDQAQRELLVIIVRAQVGHVQWNVRKIARSAGVVPMESFVRHLVQIAPQSGAQTLKRLAKRVQLIILQSHSPWIQPLPLRTDLHRIQKGPGFANPRPLSVSCQTEHRSPWQRRSARERPASLVSRHSDN